MEITVPAVFEFVGLYGQIMNAKDLLIERFVCGSEPYNNLDDNASAKQSVILNQLFKYHLTIYASDCIMGFDTPHRSNGVTKIYRKVK